MESNDIIKKHFNLPKMGVAGPKVDWAMRRIEWRFNECQTIFVNEKDKIAVETIKKWLGKLKRIEEEKLEPFINLYIYVLTCNLKKYGAEIDSKIPHRELHRVLDKQLDLLVQELMDYLISYDQNQILDMAGAKKRCHPALLSPAEKAELLKKLGDLLKIPINKQLFRGQYRDFAEIKNGLISQAKNVIESYG